MVQTVDALDAQKIAEGVKYVRDNWKIMSGHDVYKNITQISKKKK